MTHGDARSVKCPACKNWIFTPLDGQSPPYGDLTVVELLRDCPNCKVPIHFWGRWTLTVEAEKESKVK